MRARHYFVIGDPIAHSLSPWMHRAAFAQLGLPHTYETMRVTQSELPAVLDRVRRGEIHGVNVTVPHKVEALRLCDVFTDEVSVTRAVNTVFVDATGRLVGSNTDVDGLRADLLAQSVAPHAALVLGAGGAARACVVALSALCADVDIAARRDERAALLAREVGVARAVAWSTLAPPIGESLSYDLVVNATSAGMAGGPAGDDVARALDRASVTAKSVAYDLVYRPPDGLRVTPFIEHAEARGMRGLLGTGMLVEQGARALAIFLGTPISTEVRRAMRRAVTDVLARR